MTRYSLILVAAAGFALAGGPAGAQLSGPAVNGADLLTQLKNSKAEDLAAAARGAADEYNRMTPEQRAAASAAANAQIPALIGPAVQWWSTLTPEQQRAYQQQVQGLGGSLGQKP